MRSAQVDSGSSPASLCVVSVSPGEMLRLLVKQQVDAVVEEAFVLLDTLTAAYEDTASRLGEHELHTSDVPPEGLDQDPEDPELLHIKEEPEPLHVKDLQDLWTRLEGDQLIVLQEADITKFSSIVVTLKSEDDEPQTSQLYQSQMEDDREVEPPSGSSATRIETETDGEVCGGSGPARNLNPLSHSHPNAFDEKASGSSETEIIHGDWQEPLSDSGPESEDGDDIWKETRESFSFFKWSKRCYHKGFLQKHMRVHTGEKQFGCDVCGKRFAKLGNLKRHMRVHTGEKQFGCDVCGKRFPRKGSLKRHMTVHTGEKPFSCDVCGKRYTQQSSLRYHTRVHTEDKLFRCDVCGKGFPQKSNLKAHNRVHTGEKPFICKVCGKGFTEQGSLKRRTRVHTGNN